MVLTLFKIVFKSLVPSGQMLTVINVHKARGNQVLLIFYTKNGEYFSLLDIDNLQNKAIYANDYRSVEITSCSRTLL